MKTKRRLYLASQNAKKLKELKTFLGAEWDIGLASELDPNIDWDETGTTFKENALIKARVVKALVPRFCVLADDSGLVVDALGGRPGVHSSRYGGPEASDQDNISKLLKELKDVPWRERTARFVSSIIFIDESGHTMNFEGTCEGHITEAPCGQGGFGYDPIFWVDAKEKTMAELDPLEKNQVSHRGKAMSKWISSL